MNQTSNARWAARKKKIIPAPQLNYIDNGNDKLRVVKPFCYFRDERILQCNYLMHQICLEKVSQTNYFSLWQKFLSNLMWTYLQLLCETYAPVTVKYGPLMLKIYQEFQEHITQWWNGFVLLIYQISTLWFIRSWN